MASTQPPKRKPLWNPKTAAVVFLLTSLFLTYLFSVPVPFLDYLELANYDLMMYLRGPQEPPDDIVIIAIDQLSINEFDRLGLSWPWPRAIHGELVKVVNAAGARQIVFDVVFSPASADPAQDLAFAEAVQASSIPVVMAATIEQVRDSRFDLETEIHPIEPLLEAGAEEAFALINPDRDGVLRHGRLTVDGIPSLSLRAYQNLRGELDLERLPVAKYEGDDPQILINYVGGARAVPTVSYYQALDYENSLPTGTFEGKTVLVGRSLELGDLSGPTNQIDTFNTPFNVAREVRMAGVEVHANLLDSLLRERFLSRVPVPLMLLIGVLLGLLVTVFVVSLPRIRSKILAAVALLLGFAALTWILFATAGVWHYSIQPIFLGLLVLAFNTVYQYRKAERERLHIRRALKGYVSTQVMEQVLNDPAKLDLGGSLVEATVLFSDIAGFSKLSEKITPKDLSALLNDYFTKIGDAIMHFEGMINKYIGDAVMAVWGAPLANPRHAVLACRAALAMKRIVDQMPGVNCRIGLNTGVMVAGNLGHAERMEYTVIGDAVNLASRLEGANKVFGTTIMISETTEQLTDGLFLVRQLDRIRVIGKQEAVKVYELVAGVDEEIPEETLEMMRSFEAILESYDTRQWAEAARRIEEHLRRFPDDLVVRRTYKPRCEGFLELPPPDDWDGVYSLLAK